jgi:predicted transcriptional regulator
MVDPIRVTDAQFAVLEELWRDGPQTVRQLTATLYPALSTSDYATVQKLLEQLEEKSCVKRDRSGLAHVFRACLGRSNLLDAQLQQVADKLCEGSLTPVLMHLAERIRLTKTQRQELHDLLDAAKKRRTSAKREGS